MKTGLIKAVWLISGILLVFAGVLSFIYREEAVLAITVVLGLVMLISGVCSIVGYIFMHNYMLGSGWILMDGILTTILSVFLLANQIVAAAVVPFIFGIWMLFSGVTRLISSLDIKKLGLDGWGWVLLLGLLGTALGVVCFLKPVVAANIIGVTMGFVFILQGAGALYLFWITSKLPHGLEQ